MSICTIIISTKRYLSGCFTGAFRTWTVSAFGPENTAPLFVSRRVKTLACQPVGTNGMHLKLTFARQNGEPVDAIAFGQADMIETFRESGGVVDIAYSVELNEFRGKTSVQLNIKDIKGMN